MRRPLFKDEAERFFASLRAGRANATRPPLTEEQARAFHRENGARRDLEAARNTYYLTHRSGDALFPGDEETA